MNMSEGKNPLTIERSVIMKAAKINSRYTYNKCMKYLHEYGYISYFPSTNQFVSSYVYLKNFMKKENDNSGKNAPVLILIPIQEDDFWDRIREIIKEEFKSIEKQKQISEVD